MKSTIILLALLTSAFGYSSDIKDLQNTFEKSLFLEPVVNKCSKKFKGDYRSTYSGWINKNVMQIVEGLEQLKKSSGGELTEGLIMAQYAEKITKLTEELSKLSDEELKARCDAAMEAMSS